MKTQFGSRNGGIIFREKGDKKKLLGAEGGGKTLRRQKRVYVAPDHCSAEGIFLSEKNKKVGFCCPCRKEREKN